MRDLRDTTGLSWPYRFAWRMEYFFVTFTGPAHQSGPGDPKARLRFERASKVAEAYEAADRPVPEKVAAVIASHGVRGETVPYDPSKWEHVGKFRED